MAVAVLHIECDGSAHCAGFAVAVTVSLHCKSRHGHVQGHLVEWLQTCLVDSLRSGREGH